MLILQPIETTQHRLPFQFCGISSVAACDAGVHLGPVVQERGVLAPHRRTRAAIRYFGFDAPG
jgi:hypothetical protein